MVKKWITIDKVEYVSRELHDEFIAQVFKDFERKFGELEERNWNLEQMSMISYFWDLFERLKKKWKVR